MKNQGVRKKKRKTKKIDGQYQAGEENSVAEAVEPATSLNQTKLENGKDVQTNHHIEQETMGQATDPNLLQPYQFLRFANPPLHTIFVPHFNTKSINFILTIVLTAAFIVLLIFNYIKPQTGITWNCSLFQLQNKYYPRIRYNYEFWRVLISGIFHSNFAHFILNMFGIQIYGYFIEWYYGRIKYGVTLIFALILSHFLGCIAQMTTVSTMSSCILFCFLALKLYFFYQYWNYKPLDTRRIFIHLLFCLILGVNLIPTFVSNSVDYSSFIGGFVAGILLGAYYHFKKKQETLEKEETLPICQKVVKFMSPILLGFFIIACISYAFFVDNQEYRALNDAIISKCNS